MLLNDSKAIHAFVVSVRFVVGGHEAHDLGFTAIFYSLDPQMTVQKEECFRIIMKARYDRRLDDPNLSN